ncbi:MAG: hypothetical protein IRY83_11605 [Chloroflexi bacterium]|nr:hypothetical protein [Chloroflexota bacterium]
MLAPLLAAYLVVFAINIVPAMMPPTWSILAFFLIHYHLPLIPLALGGALAASAGRLVLAQVSRLYGRRLLSPRHQRNLAELGAWLENRARWATPVAVLFYSFGPIPSNELFIAAGLTGMRLRPIVAAFFVGRVISYTAWAFTAQKVVQSLEEVFIGYWSNAGFLALEIGLLALLLLFTRIDWPRLVGIRSGDAGSRSNRS